MSKPNCPRNCGNDARLHATFGILPCISCINEDHKKRKTSQAPEFTAQTMQTRVQEQRDRHEKDILPPYTNDGKPSEDFARAFPQKAKELFGEYTRVTGNEVKL